jgi:hypothetical protein
VAPLQLRAPRIPEALRAAAHSRLLILALKLYPNAMTALSDVHRSGNRQDPLIALMADAATSVFEQSRR